MTYLLGTSRKAYSNPKTEAHLRAVLARLISADREDNTRIVDILEILTTLLLALSVESEADSTMSAGAIVRVSDTDHIDLADATRTDDAGILLEDVNSGSTAKWAPYGVAERSGWALTAGGIYYLSATSAGEIVSAPDRTNDGDHAIIVGRALTTELFLYDKGTAFRYSG